MRRSMLFAVLVFSMSCQAVVAAASPAQRFLRIASAGGVYKLTGNIAMPAKDSVQRLVIDATGDETTDTGINRHLESAARALNLYALAGVPNDKVEVAVVVHGKATPMVLSDDAFRRKFGKRNPDSVLIDDLSRAGVRIFVCGQALMHQGYAVSDVAEGVTVSLSAMTALVELQSKGYALIP